MKKKLRDFTLGELNERCGKGCDGCPLYDYGYCETIINLPSLDLNKEYEVEIKE